MGYVFSVCLTVFTTQYLKEGVWGNALTGKFRISEPLRESLFYAILAHILCCLKRHLLQFKGKLY